MASYPPFIHSFKYFKASVPEQVAGIQKEKNIYTQIPPVGLSLVGHH